MSNLLYRLGAFSCASSIGLGAVGAHKLGKRDPEWISIWTTSNRYHQFGSVALLALPALSSPRAKLVGGSCIAVGTAAFAGANYLVSYHEDRNYFKSKSLLNPAPVGGGLMILGFLAVAVL